MDVAARRPAVTADGFSPERHFWAGAAFMAALGAVSLAAWAIDPRTLNGVSVWAKPLKFEISSAIHFATLALVAERLSPAWRGSRLLRATAWIAVFALVFELVWIIHQAARGEPSHYNGSSAFHAAMYTAMGVFAVALILAAAVVGGVAFVDREARFGPATRDGVALGLIIGFALTLVVAGYMGGNGSHHVGGSESDAGGLPIFGWSQTGGDLRPAHFFALHMMQALPLLGVFIDWRRWSRGLVWLAALAWTALTIAVFVQALADRPFLALT